MPTMQQSCEPALAPWPQVRVVRRRLALELRHSVDDLFLVYLGRMLKDDEVLPEECFHCRRFNFVRWLDGKGIDRWGLWDSHTCRGGGPL